MDNTDAILRLTANNNGETKCVIFVESQQKARKSLSKYVNTIVGQYPFISAFGAMVNIHRIEEIAGLDFVSAISAHTTVHTCMNSVRSHIAHERNVAPLRYGLGVTAAVIDTGIRPHPDFLMPRNRLIHFVDFVNGNQQMYDDNGHGTAVSGILCGNGLVSGGKYAGVAGRCNLISLKAIGAGGEGGAFAILEAMQWVHSNKDKYKIKVVCMSFGSQPLPKNDPLSIGAEVLWKSGIVVVASAGNSGPESGTIRSPGVNPSLITVGGVEYADNLPFVPAFSSRGPAGAYPKPDIVTDAVDITCSGGEQFYHTLTGTSMSAPVVAGVCTAMLGKNPSLSPSRIKELLLTHARPLDADRNASGYGVLDTGFLQEDL